MPEYGFGHMFLELSNMQYGMMFMRIEPELEQLASKKLTAFRSLEATVRYLTTGESPKTIGLSYNMSGGEMEEIFGEVIKIIGGRKLNDIVINTRFWKTIERSYRREVEFPHCIGAIGAVRTKAETDKKCLWFKKKITVTLFGIADTNLRIILSEALIGKSATFNQTSIYKKMMKHQLSIPPPCYIRGTNIMGPKVFVAKENFPQLRNLCTPYPRVFADMNSDFEVYNDYIEAAVVNADKAFHCLRSKFSILKKLHKVNYARVTDIYQACVNLHNYKINFVGPPQIENYKELRMITLTNCYENWDGAEECRLAMSNYIWSL